MIKKLRENISIFRLAVVLLTLVAVLNSEIENHHSQHMYAGVIFVPVYAICLIIYLVVLYFDVSLFSKSKRVISFIPSMVGGLLIFASLSVRYYHNDKMKHKTMFAATSNSVNYESSNIKYIIEFKEGNNVLVREQIDQGLLTNYYYGIFTQKDSIFILNSDQPELNISNRFLIRTVNVNGFSERELVQVDENGKEIKNQFQFIIDSYNRFRTTP